MDTFTDRSRSIEYQRCPRARYLGYEWGGVGIRRIRATIPLITGTYVHVGMADLLRQVIALEAVHGSIAWRHVKVDQAVEAAIKGYREELAARGLDVELGEDAQAVADEQVALTEGLIRVYVKAPTGLQALLATYRVVEVEKEDVWDQFAPGIVFQSRADALLQERSTGDLYVLSFKTAAGQDWRRDEEARHDVQGLSEAAVIERRLRQDHELVKRVDWDLDATKVVPTDSLTRFVDTGYLKMLQGMESAPRIMGIQMVYLVKGIRRQAYDGGPYVTSSHLLRGFYKEDVTEREYAWKEETPCPGPGHVVGYSKRSGPRLCEGKKYHKLGVDWTKFATSSLPGGIAEWIDMLASGTVQPDAGDPFESIVWMPLPYFRQDRDIHDWVEQTKVQEAKVAHDARIVEEFRQATLDGPASVRSLLNQTFPQYRRACDWPSPCQFVPVCYGDDTMLTAPMSTGLYQLRVPHHQPELDAKVGTTVGTADGAK